MLLTWVVMAGCGPGAGEPVLGPVLPLEEGIQWEQGVMPSEDGFFAFASKPPSTEPDAPRTFQLVSLGHDLRVRGRSPEVPLGALHALRPLSGGLAAVLVSRTLFPSRELLLVLMSVHGQVGEVPLPGSHWNNVVVSTSGDRVLIYGVSDDGLQGMVVDRHGTVLAAPTLLSMTVNAREPEPQLLLRATGYSFGAVAEGDGFVVVAETEEGRMRLRAFSGLLEPTQPARVVPRKDSSMPWRFVPPLVHGAPSGLLWKDGDKAFLLPRLVDASVIELEDGGRLAEREHLLSRGMTASGALVSVSLDMEDEVVRVRQHQAGDPEDLCTIDYTDSGEHDGLVLARGRVVPARAEHPARLLFLYPGTWTELSPLPVE
jgi:hypothetical protein